MVLLYVVEHGFVTRHVHMPVYSGTAYYRQLILAVAKDNHFALHWLTREP